MPRKNVSPKPLPRKNVSPNPLLGLRTLKGGGFGLTKLVRPPGVKRGVDIRLGGN
jgi:hypothetical protein